MNKKLKVFFSLSALLLVGCKSDKAIQYKTISFSDTNGVTTVYYPITAKNSRDTFVDGNWDQAFQTGTFHQNDLTISGGAGKDKYFFSLSNIAQEGIVVGSGYDRTNLRFNYKARLNDVISLSNKMAYSYSRTNRIQQSSNTAGIMLGLLRTPPDFDNTDYLGTYTSASGAETAASTPNQLKN